jgi:hypothetical protein
MTSRRSRGGHWLWLLACAAAASGGCSSTALIADGGDTSPSLSPASGCVLDAVYTYGYDGGLAYSSDRTTLSPPASYLRTRTFPGVPEPPAAVSCAPALPACNGAGVDVGDIVRDLADADVQAAFALSPPPIFGNDTRPVDGVVLQLQRADGRGFLAGAPCAAGEQLCHPLPAGVARLVSGLQALDQQQLADPTCGPLAQNH